MVSSSPPSFYAIFENLPALEIVDIGAALSQTLPIYQALAEHSVNQLIGFEPHPQAYAQLLAAAPANQLYLPYAIGDGQEHTLYLCAQADMSSLLPPDFEVLKDFYNFAAWAEVIATQQIMTQKLDQVAEIKGLDYLKIDAQGSEKMILEHGIQQLQKSLCVHLEVQFIPFYQGQALFAELDPLLRQAGFYLHQFQPLISGVFQVPELRPEQFGHWSQIMWADAVYFRQFTQFGDLPPEALLKTALIAHEVYQSYDLVLLVLGHLETRGIKGLKARYIQALELGVCLND